MTANGIDQETAEKIKQAHTTTNGFAEIKWNNIGELLDFRARGTGDKTFMIFYDDDKGVRKEFSYKEFNELVNRTANFLSDLGIRRGDKVGTLMYNHYYTPIIYFAAWKLGAVVVPLNPEEDNERCRFILENSQAKILFVKDDLAPRAENVRTKLIKNVVQVGGDGKYIDFEKEIKKRRGVFDSGAKAKDEALIIYTSGTTGLPKGVVLMQYNLFADAEGISKWYRLKPQDRMMCVLPLHHVNGIVVTIMTPMYSGGSVVLNRRFRTGTFWQKIEKERVNIVSVVPTLLQFLCEANEDTSKYDLKYFRGVICGAGPLTVELALNWQRQFGKKIFHGYGLSESTCYSCFLPIDLPLKEHEYWLSEFKFPSIGSPISPNEMGIHDEHGKELAEGAKGEIVIRGKNIMKMYFNRPDVNKETFKHGWFRSGDEGFYKTDSKGRKFFFITGRMKELIIRGGENISPLEIDEVLQKIPGVRAGIAVGFDNKWYSEEVGAYVVPQDGNVIKAEDVLRECKNHLSFFKMPKVVVFGDKIPVTSTGKYQRNRLKPLFEQYKDMQFRERDFKV